MRPRSAGFTMIEVLVALVIVAFGMSAVLAALSSAAGNVAALREKSLAQWIALNQIADVRLSLKAPMPGTTTGEVMNFGGGNWHWQQDITEMPAIPGLLQITVSVRRDTDHPLSSSSSSGVITQSINTSGSLFTPSSTLSQAGGTLNGAFSSSSSGIGFGFSSSSGSSSGIGPAHSSASSGAALFSNSASGSRSGSGGGSAQYWVTTVVGFRGDAIAAANGELPDWTGTSLAGTSSSSGASSSSGSSSSGSLFSTSSSSGAAVTPLPTPQGASAGGN